MYMYMCIYIIFMSETNLELLFFLTHTHTYICICIDPILHRTSYYVVPMFMIEIITKTFRPEPHNNHTQ